MLAITIPGYAEPLGYQLTEVPKPVITHPTEVLIRVHTASVNPVDVKKANGASKMAVKEQFPYTIGHDCAGTIEEVDSTVAKLIAGDEVYARLPEIARGSWGEYVKSPADYVALKPPSLSFAQAASLPLTAMTALQALQKYEGGLAGKTVFVPAGLSGTGLAAVQLAKTIFGAGKVLTTVSTTKVAQMPLLLDEDVVDQGMLVPSAHDPLQIWQAPPVIDYTKSDPLQSISKGSVDFILDTTGSAMQMLPLLRRRSGVVISISTLPSGDQMQASDIISKLRAWRWGVRYEYMFLQPNSEDLDLLREYVEKGKLKPVVGKKVKLRDIDAVREACHAVFTGKGGLGKTVIEVVSDV